MGCKLLHTRLIRRRDMPTVAVIDRLVGLDLGEELFLQTLKDRDTTGFVIERAGMVIGYLVYRFYRRRFQILNFAVHPEWQRGGAGACLIERIKEDLNELIKLPGQKIVVDVPEDRLPVHLFLKSQGFNAVAVAGIYRFTFRGFTGEEDGQATD